MTETAHGTVATRIVAVRTAIAEACRRSGRDVGDVLLVGASKTVPVQVVAAAFAAGLQDFAENYARELSAKAPVVPARWHFIGRLQRGTAAQVAAYAHVVHSAEPGHAAEVLARRLVAAGRTLPVLLEVDQTGRRLGVGPDDAAEALAAMSDPDRYGGLEVVGLMTLPPFDPDPERSRPYFRRLRELRDSLGRRHPNLRGLSMGMSADYTVAVEEGATMVRVGTALFGARDRVEPNAGPAPDHPGA